MIPSFTSEKANTRVGRRDHDVGARDEAAAAAERMAVHARHDRRRAGVDRLEHLPQPPRVGDVLLVAELDRAAHPVDVGAGREALALAGEQHRAHVVADRRESLGQLRDQLGVEGVAPLGARHRDAEEIAVLFDPERLHRCAS